MVPDPRPYVGRITNSGSVRLLGGIHLASPPQFPPLHIASLAELEPYTARPNSARLDPARLGSAWPGSPRPTPNQLGLTSNSIVQLLDTAPDGTRVGHSGATAETCELWCGRVFKSGTLAARGRRESLLGAMGHPAQRSRHSAVSGGHPPPQPDLSGSPRASFQVRRRQI